jgi:choline-sulfatase
LAPKKPNILYIFADQMRGDCLGSLPDSKVITPNLNRLSSEGVTFTRCMSNSPLCVPARSALMTGQLPRENGIWSNRCGADENGPSHVRNIRDAGYHTGVIGKTHLWRHSASGKTGLHVSEMDHNLAAWGFEDRLEINDPIETGWMDCHYTDYLASKGLLQAHREFIMNWVRQAYREGNPIPWEQPPAPVPEGEDIDSFVGLRSVEWLSEYNDSRPFYLQVQFTGPHDPYDGPQSYRDQYDHSMLDEGITQLPDPVPASLKARLARTQAIVNATKEQRQKWRVGYYANITLIDDWVGRILAAVAAKGELDNTWVIFSSDHGEMLGDHGMWSKANFYRQSVHVPCILRPAASRPLQNQTGWASSALIQQIDLPVTMIDIAAAKPLEDPQGDSLTHFVDLKETDAAASEGKAAVFSELFGQSTVITDDYKLTVRVDDSHPQQLFELEQDPDELNNSVRQSEATVSDLIATHVRPFEDHINRPQLSDYRDYVRETGSVN